MNDQVVTNREVLEQLISDICHLAHKHEVQTWKDAPGTDDEKRQQILKLAREALHIVKQDKRQ